MNGLQEEEKWKEIIMRKHEEGRKEGKEELDGRWASLVRGTRRRSLQGKPELLTGSLQGTILTVNSVPSSSEEGGGFGALLPVVVVE